MKKIRNSLVGLLAICLSFGMAACSSTEEPAVTTMTATEKETEAVTTEVTEEESSVATDETAAESQETTASSGEIEFIITEDIEKIIERGVLRVGVKDAVQGFGFQDIDTGEYSGLEINIAERLAEELGVEEVEFTVVTAATRTELLDSGDIDCVIATFTITEERKESWDFTTSYYKDYVTLLVEDSSGITSLADLTDKVVGVSSGSTSARATVAAMVEQGILDSDNFDPETFDPATWTEGVSFRQFDDYPAINTALSAGQVDAFGVDKSILAIYRTEGRSYIEDEFAPQEYGIATKKDTGFSAYCEALILQIMADGTLDGWIQEFGI